MKLPSLNFVIRSSSRSIFHTISRRFYLRVSVNKFNLPLVEKDQIKIVIQISHAVLDLFPPNVTTAITTIRQQSQIHRGPQDRWRNSRCYEKRPQRELSLVATRWDITNRFTIFPVSFFSSWYFFRFAPTTGHGENLSLSLSAETRPRSVPPPKQPSARDLLAKRRLNLSCACPLQRALTRC